MNKDSVIGGLNVNENVSGAITSSEAVSGNVEGSQTLSGTIETASITGTIGTSEKLKGGVSARNKMSGSIGIQQPKVLDVLVNGASVVENRVAKVEVPEAVLNLTQADIDNWNSKSNFNGEYDSLQGKPTKLSDFENDSGYITADEAPKYKATDNVVIEDETLKVVTNTGYKVIDKDIQMQPIADSGTTGTNKMVYTDDEVTIIYDGTNKIRRSENGIDFKLTTLPCTCKAMAYNSDAKRLYGTDGNNYFIFSEDNGVTWKMVTNAQAKGVNYLDIGFGAGFRAINKSAKRIIGFTFNENNSTISTNTTITSTIVPDHIAMVNNTQFVWCNSSGTFKYGAGSTEGAFASLSGITANLLKRVNNITILGLKNNNKMYLLEPAASIRDYKWVDYTLPDTCTVNDIIFNPYDETYYIFTTVNTYYKTKDFITFETVDKNSFRGIQGYFTLMGIQMVTSEKNYLLLAPTRTTLENKAQEWDRALNKERWVGNGLGVDGEKIYVKVSNDTIGVNNNGIYIKELSEHVLPDYILESAYVTKAEIKDNFDPYEIENWFWEFGIPSDDTYQATKFIFNQAGSFYNMATWEEEYIVEQNEYGYIFSDSGGGLFKYVKLGIMTNIDDTTASDTTTYSSNKIEEMQKVNITTGSEVATNEYIDGKRVYKKRIDCGYLPNATYKNIAHGLDIANCNIIDIRGIARKGTSIRTIPSVSTGNATYNISSYIDGNQLTLETGIDRSEYTAYVDIYYTKN
jgi:hypothetical protein